MELSDFDNYREGNRLEAKLARGGLPKNVWESYSAFANSAGGVILLGVEELQPSGALVVAGVDNPEALVSDFWNTVNNPQKVSTNILADDNVTVAEVQDKAVVRIDVPRANRRQKPVFLNDNPKRCFRRNHSGDYLCHYNEIQSMIRDACEVTQDSAILANVSMSELDDATVDSYRRRYELLHEGHPWNALTRDEFLRVLGAAASDGGELHPTMAGLLLFGLDWRIREELPSYFLDYRQQTSSDTRWQNRVTSSDGDWSGNVYDFFFRAYNLMKQSLKTPFQMKGIERVDDTPAHRALREALANALTNANFHESRGVVCLWEDSRLVIANPGDFRVDIDAAMRGGESDPRNATLMRMLSYINVGERAGSGLPKIMTGWRECGLGTPRYEEQTCPDRTVLTLPLEDSVAASQIKENAGNGAAAGLPCQRLDSREKTALALASQLGAVTTGKLAAEAGIGKRTASSVLKGLAAEGLLTWVGKSANDPYQHYIIASH